MTARAPDFTAFIGSCLREASAVALRMRGAVEATAKPTDVNQIVTDTDLAVGELLAGRIRERYPRHAILDEEIGAIPGDDEITWIVDPLDGTSNYAAGSPLFGVMMAAVGPHGPVAGGMALPAFGSAYVAQTGRGATRDGQRIGPLPTVAVERSLVACGLDKGPEDVMAAGGRLVAAIGTVCLGVRTSNSVFDICMVADGAYGAFVHRGCRIWDVAAAVCVLVECGGICTDLDGRPVDLTHPLEKADQVFEVCFASAAVHPSLMTAVKAAKD